MKPKRFFCVGVFLFGTVLLFSAGFARDTKVTQPRMQGRTDRDCLKLVGWQ